MDAKKFDGIVRTLGQGMKRRSAFKALAGGALGAVGLSRIGIQRASADPPPALCPNQKDSKCPSGCQCLDKVCVKCPKSGKYELDKEKGKCVCKPGAHCFKNPQRQPIPCTQE